MKISRQWILPENRNVIWKVDHASRPCSHICRSTLIGAFNWFRREWFRDRTCSRASRCGDLFSILILAAGLYQLVAISKGNHESCTKNLQLQRAILSVITQWRGSYVNRLIAGIIDYEVDARTRCFRQGWWLIPSLAASQIRFSFINSEELSLEQSSQDDRLPPTESFQLSQVHDTFWQSVSPSAIVDKKVLFLI